MTEFRSWQYHSSHWRFDIVDESFLVFAYLTKGKMDLTMGRAADTTLTKWLSETTKRGVNILCFQCAAQTVTGYPASLIKRKLRHAQAEGHSAKQVIVFCIIQKYQGHEK